MEVFGGILVLVVLLILGVPVAITFLLSAMFIVITTGTDPAFYCHTVIDRHLQLYFYPFHYL